MTEPATHPALSVVVITRNEAERIERCLDAVFEACREGPEFEVLLVDSASTDRTVERARAYPVAIYRIDDEQLATPAAGRYVGTRLARGDRLLFVDGDMELWPDWLPRALEALSEPGVAAVDGRLNEAGPDARDRDVEAVRGVALYDRRALQQVGGFDPFLRSVEDIDLGFRLTAAGYRLRRTAAVAASHPRPRGLGEPLRRWRNGYPFGPGQAIRRSLRRPTLLRKHLRRIRYKLLAGGWLLVGVLSLASPLTAVLWLVGTGLGVAWLTVKMGPAGAAQYGLNTVLGVLGLGPGLLLPVRSRDEFAMDAVEVVQPPPPRSGSPSRRTESW